ncbi:MAG: 2-amino-4-hydroxy-6-hydroxymethyldihydropteridine diphosphokinase [Bacteroidales bacterium]|nr:2-amino-4-hydroxy-6-hydroxymethyldihydropteridine diphosphokinase [Bacteroidales bacterium]
MNEVLLLLGSNKGDRLNFLNLALDRIDQISLKTPVVSHIYESEPWGFDSKTWFLNMAVSMQTDLSPIDLLDKLMEIESDLGRKRDPEASGYESREIDIDIILFGEKVIESERLTIPHPRAHLRRFVLLPLNDIASDYTFPGSGKSIRELLNVCPDKSEVLLWP